MSPTLAYVYIFHVNLRFASYQQTASQAYDTVHFEGPVLSVLDLKKAIVNQKKMMGNDDFDLFIQNAQTGEGE